MLQIENHKQSDLDKACSLKEHRVHSLSYGMHVWLLARDSFMIAANTRVTLYEEITRDTFLEAGRPVCDLRIYPAGQLWLRAQHTPRGATCVTKVCCPLQVFSTQVYQSTRFGM